MKDKSCNTAEIESFPKEKRRRNPARAESCLNPSLTL